MSYANTGVNTQETRDEQVDEVRESSAPYLITSPGHFPRKVTSLQENAVK